MTTTTYNGQYAPRHVQVVWVENSSGAWYKTLGVWAAERKVHLTTWTAKHSSYGSDATTGATLSSHGTQTMAWDVSGVADGTYKVFAEMTESTNATVTKSITVTVANGTVTAVN